MKQRQGHGHPYHCSYNTKHLNCKTQGRGNRELGMAWLKQEWKKLPSSLPHDPHLLHPPQTVKWQKERKWEGSTYGGISQAQEADPSSSRGKDSAPCLREREAGVSHWEYVAIACRKEGQLENTWTVSWIYACSGKGQLRLKGKNYAHVLNLSMSGFAVHESEFHVIPHYQCLKYNRITPLWMKAFINVLIRVLTTFYYFPQHTYTTYWKKKKNELGGNGARL